MCEIKRQKIQPQCKKVVPFLRSYHLSLNHAFKSPSYGIMHMHANRYVDTAKCFNDPLLLCESCTLVCASTNHVISLVNDVCQDLRKGVYLLA